MNRSPWNTGDWQGRERSAQEIVVAYPQFSAQIIGAPETLITRKINGVADIASAGAHHLSFAKEGIPPELVERTKAGILIAHPIWQEAIARHHAMVAIITPDPHGLFIEVANHFFAQPEPTTSDERDRAMLSSTINPSVKIGAFAVIGRNVTIGEGSVIGSHVVIGDDVAIGAHVWIYPHVTLYPHTRIGKNTMIHAGTVIGSDGFGFQKTRTSNPKNAWQKVPQMGGVVIGEGVEIGAQCAIDRGALTDTHIGHGCKIDNGVHIGHGCVIGTHTLIMGQSGFAGSVTMGDDCIVAGQCGFAPGISIANQVVVHPKAGVFHDITESGEYSGTWPLMPHRLWLRTQALLKKMGRKKSAS